MRTYSYIVVRITIVISLFWSASGGDPEQKNETPEHGSTVIKAVIDITLQHEAGTLIKQPTTVTQAHRNTPSHHSSHHIAHTSHHPHLPTTHVKRAAAGGASMCGATVRGSRAESPAAVLYTCAV